MMERGETNFATRLGSIALIALVFAIWEGACRAFAVSSFVLPLPSQIALTLARRWADLMPHLIQTVETTLAGFLMSVVAGIVLGGLIGTFRIAYGTIYPLLIGFSSIPKVAIIPIFVVWFGAGTWPAVLTAFVISLFPIVVNVATGLAATEPELEDVLRALGASRFDIFWNAGLPRAAPYLFASMKIAITVAFIGSITSESIASNRGIGNAMLVASANFDMPLVFAGLTMISITGILLYALFSVLERRLAGWSLRREDLAV